MNLKVLDSNGAGYVSDVVRAIDWAIAKKGVYGIRVLNLSLGHPPRESFRTDPLTRAVERAWAAGLTVVVSAGNRGRDGYATINSPGNDPYVITVGTMKMSGAKSRTDDLITSFSSKGPTLVDHVVKPDLVAPGNKVVAMNSGYNTLWQNYGEVRVSDPCTDCYIRLSGTSGADSKPEIRSSAGRCRTARGRAARRGSCCGVGFAKRA